jgi:fructokinase
VDTTDPGHPSFTIHEDVAWDHLEFDDSLGRLMAGAAAVCFGTLAQRSPRSRETVQRCLEAAGNALKVYDVNLRPPWHDRAWIEQSMRAASVVKLNDDEVRGLIGMLDMQTETPGDFAHALQGRFGVQIVCVTRAERGCLIIRADETADQPGLTVDVADAVGAGDAFTAALISALLRQWPLTVAAGFANEVGAMVASRSGAMPRLGSELADLISKTEGAAS